MDLNFTSREQAHKGKSKRLRHSGQIPGVLYRKDLSANISICDADFQGILRNVKKGELSTVRFNLKDEQGNTIQAILKEIQYHPTSYKVLHLDFQELQADRPVRIRVPLVLTGRANCIGITQGGTPRQPVQSILVSCLPKDIPTRFELNIANLALRKALKCSAIEFPKGVRPIDETNTTAVSIVKR